jgi:hypothetical protein
MRGLTRALFRPATTRYYYCCISTHLELLPLHHEPRPLGRLNYGPEACSVVCMLAQSAHVGRPQVPAKGVDFRPHTRH